MDCRLLGDVEAGETVLPEDAVTLAERAVLSGVDGTIQQLQADLLEQQSINNYQVEAAMQEREKVGVWAIRSCVFVKEPGCRG
jgi:hypothetical protein